MPKSWCQYGSRAETHTGVIPQKKAGKAIKPVGACHVHIQFQKTELTY